MASQVKNILFNTCIALNSLLLFLLLFGTSIKLPPILQVAGRMHPLMLHFPVVLVMLAFIWELFSKDRTDSVFKETGDWFLLAASFTAVLAALMGLFLSKEEGYDADIIALHKWTGAATAFICFLWFVFRNTIRKHKAGLVATGLSGIIVLLIAGHQGATITHGNNFLLAPVTPQKNKPPVLLEDAIVYIDMVRPILETKCINCHNNRKAKGDLIMETEALLLKGGKNGVLWDSTKSDFGLLLQRIHLPLENKKHMPPKNKTQLTVEEINTLYFWIKGGASFTKKVTELPLTDTLRLLATTLFSSTQTDVFNFLAADESVIKKLNSDYRVVQPLAAGSPALSVSFFSKSFFKADQLKDLEKIKEQVVSLNLNKMPVTDNDIKEIPRFKNLQHLNLSFTRITGASLSNISKLSQLRSLSVSGTAIKATDLELLKGMKSLSKIFIWNTGVTESEMTVLKQTFPKVDFEKGFNGDTILAKLNLPVVEGDEQVFTGTATIKLKHYINGVTLRYTTDGTDPDSLASPIYKEGVTVEKSGVLKAKAFLPGWISSDVLSRNFYRTKYKADSVMLVKAPDLGYAGTGGKTIIDGEKGDLNFRSGKWLGYKDDDMQAFLFFKEPVLLSNVSVSTVVDIGSYIFPVRQIEIWGGSGTSDLKLLYKETPKQPTTQVPPYLIGFDCNFKERPIKLLKIVARPITNIPLWHPGKRQRGWVFVDEIFLN
jgi:uncharacterized membrane protein